MNVEQAQTIDIPQIAALAFTTYKEVELQLAPPEFSEVIRHITDSVLNGLAFVIRNPNSELTLDGVIVLQVNSPWWSLDENLQQLFFYVSPAVRDGKHFNALLEKALECATILQRPLVQDVVGQRHASKGAKLKRKGYTKIGESFIITPSL